MNVVKMINNDYKGKIMTLDQYLTEGNKNFSLKEIYTFLDDIEKMQHKIAVEFTDEIEEKLKDMDCKKEKTYVDVTMKNFLIRYYTNGSKLLLQIGDKESIFTKELEDNLKLEILKELQKINKNFFGTWKNAYGELKMGDIKFQTRNKLLEDIVAYNNQLNLILEKF